MNEVHRHKAAATTKCTKDMQTHKEHPQQQSAQPTRATSNSSLPTQMGHTIRMKAHRGQVCTASNRELEKDGRQEAKA